MLWSTAQIVLFPVLAGAIANSSFPKTTAKVAKVTPVYVDPFLNSPPSLSFFSMRDVKKPGITRKKMPNDGKMDTHSGSPPPLCVRVCFLTLCAGTRC